MTNGKEPIFPQFWPGQGEILATQHFGLTKRALFAAMAMQGILATNSEEYPVESFAANLAVAYADALIAELAKEQR